MLMQIYKNDDPQDFTFEHILKHNKLKKSINTHLYSKVKILKEFGMEWEDIESEINMALFKAYKTYDNSSSVFVTYALTVVKNEIQKLLNHVTRQKRYVAIEKDFDSFDRDLDAHDDSNMTLECTISNNEPLPEDVLLSKEFKSFINSQDNYTKDLMLYMMKYVDINYITNKYGYSKVYHYGRMDSLKSKLRNDLKSKKPSTSTLRTTKVKLIKNGNTIGIFSNLTEAKNISEKVFRIKLHNVATYLMLSKFVG